MAIDISKIRYSNEVKKKEVILAKEPVKKEKVVSKTPAPPIKTPMPPIIISAAMQEKLKSGYAPDEKPSGKPTIQIPFSKTIIPTKVSETMPELGAGVGIGETVGKVSGKAIEKGMNVVPLNPKEKAVLQGYVKGLVKGSTAGYVKPPVSEDATVEEQQGEALGEFVGAVLPIGASLKVAKLITSRFGEKAVRPRLRRLATGMLAGGMYGGAESLEEGEDRLQKILDTSALFGVFEMGGEAIGTGIKIGKGLKYKARQKVRLSKSEVEGVQSRLQEIKTQAERTEEDLLKEFKVEPEVPPAEKPFEAKVTDKDIILPPEILERMPPKEPTGKIKLDIEQPIIPEPFEVKVTKEGIEIPKELIPFLKEYKSKTPIILKIGEPLSLEKKVNYATVKPTYPSGISKELQKQEEERLYQWLASRPSRPLTSAEQIPLHPAKDARQAIAKATSKTKVTGKPPTNTEIISKEADILAKSEIPEDDIIRYVQHTKADGENLRIYTTKVLQGKMTEAEALQKIQADYKKIVPKEKVIPSKPTPAEKETVHKISQLVQRAKTKEDIKTLEDGVNKIEVAGKLSPANINQLKQSIEKAKAGLDEKIIKEARAKGMEELKRISVSTQPKPRVIPSELKAFSDEQLKRRYDFAIEQLSSPKVTNKSAIEKEAQLIADERVRRQLSPKSAVTTPAVEVPTLESLGYTPKEITDLSGEAIVKIRQEKISAEEFRQRLARVKEGLPPMTPAPVVEVTPPKEGIITEYFTAKAPALSKMTKKEFVNIYSHPTQATAIRQLPGKEPFTLEGQDLGKIEVIAPGKPMAVKGAKEVPKVPRAEVLPPKVEVAEKPKVEAMKEVKPPELPLSQKSILNQGTTLKGIPKDEVTWGDSKAELYTREQVKAKANNYQPYYTKKEIEKIPLGKEIILDKTDNYKRSFSVIAKKKRNGEIEYNITHNYIPPSSGMGMPPEAEYRIIIGEKNALKYINSKAKEYEDYYLKSYKEDVAESIESVFGYDGKTHKYFYEELIKDGEMTANDAKTIIESAGLKVPDNILVQAIKETKGVKPTSVPTEKAPVTAEPVKEPWQMTKEEYIAHYADEDGDFMAFLAARDSKANASDMLPILDKRYKEKKEFLRSPEGTYRYITIKNALAEGKPVPPEVLKDYPDLAKKVTPGPRAGGIQHRELALKPGEELAGREAPIRITKDMNITDLQGKKVELPEGEEYTPYMIKDKSGKVSKVLLQDGERVIINKGQFQNIKGQNIQLGEGQPRAGGMTPEPPLSERMKKNIAFAVTKAKERGLTPEQYIRSIGADEPSTQNFLNILKRYEQGAGLPILPEKMLSGLREKGFVKTVKESPKTTSELKEAIGDTVEPFYEPLPNKESLQRVDNFIKKNPNQAEARILSSELVSAEKTLLGFRLMKHYEKNNDVAGVLRILESYDLQLREAGRGIQAVTMWSKLDPVTIMRIAKRIADKNKITLSTDSYKGLIKRMREIQKMPEGEERATAMLEVLNYIADQMPMRLREKIWNWWDAYRYTNMLSNPKSHERNIISNTLNTFVYRPLDLISEASWDIIRHPFNPLARDVKFKAVPQYYSGVITSFDKAWIGAKEAFRREKLPVKFFETGRTEGRGLSPESLIEQIRKEKSISEPLTYVFKLLESQDKFFSTLIGNGEKLRLIRSGVSEEVATQQAQKIAERYLYREKLGQEQKARLVRALDNVGIWTMQARDKAVIGPLWSMFVPFIRTPTNIAKMNIEHSIFGISRRISPSQQAHVFGGTLVSGIGALLALQDRTCWLPPTDPKGKELFYASGRQSFSVKIGDSWVSMWWFGPYSLALALPAAVKHYVTETKTSLTDSEIEKIGNISIGLIRYISSQTSLTGMANFFNILEGDIDYRMPGQLGFASTQAIPLSGLISYVNTILDPIYRKSPQYLDSIKKAIPGATKGLESYKTPTGELATRLPISYVLPWDIKPTNNIYEDLLTERIEKQRRKFLKEKLQKQSQDTRTKISQVPSTKVQIDISKIRYY